MMLTKFSSLNNQGGGAKIGVVDESDLEVENDVLQISRPLKEEDDLSNVYTVEEAVHKIGFGVFQILLSLFCGAAALVEALEVMILSILSAALKCEWNLSSVQEATITTVVFFGFLLGNPVWGTVADKYGRKKALLGALCWGFVFSIISPFSPNYYTLLLFRGLVGFGFGGGFLGPAYCIEFLPAKSRSVILCLLEFPWAVGSIMEALLALVVMTSIDHQPWRWLLGLTALPLLIVIPLFVFVPESPRYLILKGKEDEAKKVLALIAKVNCRPPLSGRLVTQEEKERMLKERNQTTVADNEQVETSVAASDNCSNEIGAENVSYETQPNKEESIDTALTPMPSDDESDSVLLLQSNEHTHRRFSQSYLKSFIKVKAVNYYHWFLLLFRNGWWRTTLLLWYIWFSAALMYFGGTLLTTSLFQNNEHCGVREGNDTDDETCRPLSKSDYIHLVWTTCAEFPGTIWIIAILLIIGRRKAITLTALLTAVCYGLLFFCLGKTLLTVFLFGVRGFATGFFQAIVLYTSEVYPTTVRGFGLSLCSAITRIGSMCSPFIAQTLVSHNTIATIILFIIITVMASLAALLLPIETKGRAMKDSTG